MNASTFCFFIDENILTHVLYTSECTSSLMPSPRSPPGEKQSGEQSRISWSFPQKVVRTNEIVRSVIIMYFPYNSPKKFLLEYLYFFLSRFGVERFEHW